jgi:hypothetical protein
MGAGRDSSGNAYVEVRNVRITAVPETWDNAKPGLRIQAYKGKGDALFPGAEIAIPDQQTAYEFIKAVFHVLDEIGV